MELNDKQKNLLKALIRKQIKNISWVLENKELEEKKFSELKEKTEEWKIIYKLLFLVEYNPSLSKEKSAASEKD